MMDQQACTIIIKQLFEHLNGWSSVRPLNDGCMVVTPFQHYDHSFIELYVEFREGGYHISDDGETLAMLFVSGLPIDHHSPWFQVVEHIAQDDGVDFEQDILSVQATEQNLGARVYALIHAIQRVGFLIYRRSHRKKPTFKEEVETLILKSEVLYAPDYTVRGRANTHTVDFYINSGRNILIDTLSATNASSARDKTKKNAYKYLDLNAGGIDHRFVLVVDDRKEESRKAWQDAEIQSTFITYFEGNLFYWGTDQSALLHLFKGS
jgi:hypothetical protein